MRDATKYFPIGKLLRRGLYMLRDTANDFAPVYMTTVDEVPMYRLVVSRKRGDDEKKVIIYLGDRLVRWLEESQLPDEIKVKLAMIDVMDVDWKNRYINANYRLTPYILPDPKFEDVGWRFGTNMYTVIVPAKLIGSLRGESINKEHKS